MVDKILFAGILLIGVTAVKAGEYCDNYVHSDDNWDDDNSYWCEHGCCTYGCCGDTTIGMIIVIVIGTIAFVVLVATVLVAIFCCCRKSRGRAGQVCQPPSTSIQMQTLGYGQPGYAQPGYQTVVTSGMAPGTLQTWQQSPPTYDQLDQKYLT